MGSRGNEIKQDRSQFMAKNDGLNSNKYATKEGVFNALVCLKAMAQVQVWLKIMII